MWFHRVRVAAASLVLALAASAGCGGDGVDPRPASFTFIATTILAPQCATASCHSEIARVADYRFETVEAAWASLQEMEALDPAVIGPTGDIGCNPLVMMLLNGPSCAGEAADLTMPPDAPLPIADVELIETWLIEGAEYP